MESINHSAPLLNDYKITFVWRRVVQVICGGISFSFNDTSHVPLFVYLFQVVLAIIPVIVGVPLVVLHDSFNDDWIAAIIFAGVVGSITLLIKSLSVYIQRTDDTQGVTQAVASLSEEEEYHFDRFWSAELFGYVIPVPTHKYWLPSILLQSVISGCVCFGAFFYMLPSNLEKSYPGMNVILFQVFGWLSLVLCQYSLTARPPAEPNQFRSHDTNGLVRYTRTIYLLIFFIVNLVFTWVPDSSTIDGLYYTNKVFHVIYLFLPVIFALGLFPQIEVLFSWALEQTHIFFLGGSATASDSRLYWLFILGSANVAVVYSSYVVYDYLSMGLGAGLGFILSSDIVSFSKKQMTRNMIYPMNVPRLQRKRLTHYPSINFLFALIIGGVAGVVAAFDNEITNNHDTMVRCVLDIVILCSLALHALCIQLQRPYMFSFIKNPLYLQYQKYLSYISLIASKVGSVAITLLLALYGLQHSHSRILLARAFRWAWQSTPAALLEMTIVEWCLVYAYDNRNWDLPLVLFYAALVDDRLFQFLHKMHYVFVSLTSVWATKKLRFTRYRMVISLNVIFFPLVIGIVVISCAFSAPIIPFLGIPFFVIAYPRPQRVWHLSGKNYQHAKDTIYYKQLVPRLVGEMANSFGKGLLGYGSVGDMYLLRLESKLVWVHILERGNKYVSALVKGLELQETSCHHAEATKIDEIFDHMLEGVSPLPVFNKYLTHTLQPLGKIPVLTYANNNMILTGIIDHPDNLKKIPDFFWKTLIYLLRRWKTSDKMADRQHQFAKFAPMFRDSHSKFPSEWYNFLNARAAATPRRSKTPRPPTAANWTSPSPHPSRSPTPAPTPPPDHPPTPPYLNHPLAPIPALPPAPNIATSWQSTPLPPLPTISPVAEPSNDVDDFLSEWSAFNKGTDWRNTNNARASQAVSDGAEQPLVVPEEKKPEEKKPEIKSARRTSVTWDMKEGNNGTELRPLKKSTLEPIAERPPRDPFVDLVCICHSIVETLGGHHDPYAGPRHVHDIYVGTIPSSYESSFLESDDELCSVVLLAYKYAFKLVFDECSLGDFENDNDVLTQLEEYNRSWYFGMDTTDEWMDNIQSETENLFSISLNEGVYTAHILSLRKQPISAAKLNGEAARALWSSLNQELLFFTNDDDERYSIQAHPDLLRNITVQAAEPPLGYPVFGKLYDIPL